MSKRIVTRELHPSVRGVECVVGLAAAATVLSVHLDTRGKSAPSSVLLPKPQPVKPVLVLSALLDEARMSMEMHTRTFVLGKCDGEPLPEVPNTFLVYVCQVPGTDAHVFERVADRATDTERPPSLSCVKCGKAPPEACDPDTCERVGK